MPDSADLEALAIWEAAQSGDPLDAEAIALWQARDQMAPAKSQRGWGDYAYDMAGSALNGLTMGFGDKLTAATGSALGRGSYDANLDTLRQRTKDFRQSNPVSSLAGEVVGGLPLAATGAGWLRGAGLLRQAATGAAVGAGAGAVYGAGEAPAGQELVGAAQGAPMGAAFGAAGPIVGAGVKQVAQGPVGRMVRDVADGVSERLRRQVVSEVGKLGGEAAANSLSQADIAMLANLKEQSPEQYAAAFAKLAQAQADNVPLFLPEAFDSKSLDKVARNYANMPGGEDIAETALRIRKAGQRGRVKGYIDEAIPTGPKTKYELTKEGLEAVEERLGEIRRERQAAARPLYKAAETEAPIIDSPRVQALLAEDGFVDQGLRALYRDMPNYKKLPPNSFRVLDDLRGKLWDMSRQAARAGENNRAGRLVDRWKTLTNEMDAVSPSFREARQTYGDFSRGLEGIQDGAAQVLLSVAEKDMGRAAKKLMSLEPDQIPQVAQAFGPENRDKFLGLFKAAMLEEMRVGDKRNVADKLWGNEYTRDLARAALGQEQFTKLDTALKLEQKMAEAAQRYHPGSSTAGNIQTAGQQNQIVQQAGQLAGRLSGVPGAHQAASMLSNAFARKPNEQATAEVARILFDRDLGLSTLQRLQPYHQRTNALMQGAEALGRGSSMSASQQGGYYGGRQQ